MATMFRNKKTGVITDRSGRVMEPVADWNENQHKLHNAYDKAYLDDDFERMAEISELLLKFDSQIVGKTVYAVPEDREKMLGIIIAYDERTDRIRSEYIARGGDLEIARYM